MLFSEEIVARVKRSSLAGPIGVRDGAPSRADRFVFIGRERACRCVADILRDTLDSRRADDRGADAGGAECEPERRCDGGLSVAAEKIVAELLQAVPIWLRVPIGWRLCATAPCGVGGRALDNHRHPAR